jgi:Asp-tRNA(Asn)/Glu-tRNA(Gln) amidotransferase B subunit
LTSRVDKLQEKSNSDDILIRDLTKKINESDSNFKELCQQINLKSDRDSIKLQQMLQDVISKQKNVDNVRQEQEGQNRLVQY